MSKPRRTKEEMVAFREQLAKDRERRKQEREKKKNLRESKTEVAMRAPQASSQVNSKAKIVVEKFCKANFITPSGTNAVLRDTLERFYDYVRENRL